MGAGENRRGGWEWGGCSRRTPGHRISSRLRTTQCLFARSGVSFNDMTMESVINRWNLGMGSRPRSAGTLNYSGRCARSVDPNSEATLDDRQKRYGLGNLMEGSLDGGNRALKIWRRSEYAKGLKMELEMAKIANLRLVKM